jgi:hypothetical protein
MAAMAEHEAEAISTRTRRRMNGQLASFTKRLREGILEFRGRNDWNYRFITATTLGISVTAWLRRFGPCTARFPHDVAR